jgi:hypothetical protein
MPAGEQFRIEALERRRLLAGGIEGVVFNDLNGNATRDATEGVWPGITVWLDTNRNRTQDAGEPSAVTDATGTYRFNDLAAGEYSVRMALDDRSVQSALNLGRVFGAPSYVVNGSSTRQYILTREFRVGASGWDRSFAFGPMSQVFDATYGTAVGVDRVYGLRQSTGQVIGVPRVEMVRPNTREVLGSFPVPTLASALGADLAYLDGELFVQHPGLPRIDVFDPVSGSLKRTLAIAIPTAHGLAGVPEQGLIVARPAGASPSQVLFIDPQSGATVRALSLDLQSFPFNEGLAYSDGELLISTHKNSTSTPVTDADVPMLARFDAMTGAPLGRINVIDPLAANIGSEYRLVALGGDGTSAPRVSVVDGQTATAIPFGVTRISAPTNASLRQVSDLPAGVAARMLGRDFVIGATVTPVVWSNGVETRFPSFVATTTTGTFDLPGSVASATEFEFEFRQAEPGRRETGGYSTVWKNPAWGGVPAPLLSLPSGYPATWRYTNDNTPTFKSIDPRTYQLLLNGEPIVTWTGNATRPSTYTINAPLPDGTYYLTANQGSFYQLDDTPFVIDTVAPQLKSLAFDVDALDVVFTFDSLGGLSAATPMAVVQARHETTGQIYTLEFDLFAGQLYDYHYRFTTPPVPGRYKVLTNATALADGAGNFRPFSMPNFTFTVLPGDANSDAVVNFDDLLILAANYNQSSRVFSQGDFNRNGTVNFDDLLILASRYNVALPGTVAATVPPNSGADDDDDSEANDVLA